MRSDVLDNLLAFWLAVQIMVGVAGLVAVGVAVLSLWVLWRYKG